MDNQYCLRVCCTLKGLTFTIRFQTAQFKEHTQKLTRRTYLIPPPSVVAGLFGAILGISRNNLYELGKKILTGADLINFEGRTVNLARIFRIDKSVTQLINILKKYYNIDNKERLEIIKNIQELLPTKESEELYMAEYKFAIASSDENLIDKGFRRLRDLDFEYDIFGGNDYHFVDFIGNASYANVKKRNQARGYCRRKDFEGIGASSFEITWNISNAQRIPLVIPVTFLANVNEEFIAVYGTDIISKRELYVVDDGKSQIFVYEVAPFIVSWENVKQ